jgi:threonyl-tRNA synthetase
MVHRSIVGSIERAVAHLVEQHGGAFPPWLAPVQVVVVPISSGEMPAATAVAGSCDRLGLRASVAAPDQGSLGARIRAARLVPYQLVIGARELVGAEAAGPGLAVAVRLRDGRRLPPLPAADALARISAVVGEYGTRLWDG